jgi:hypothetical protein
MHVSIAPRVSYFLSLERTSFRNEEGDELHHHPANPTLCSTLAHHRLAWAACYISDRQISIRVGRAFWSRGPGPLIALRRQDFPSLQPEVRGDGSVGEDYASIFQATLDLTQLFSNVHDVLYASRGSSVKLMAGGLC